MVFSLFLLTDPKMLVLQDWSRSKGHTRGTLESCLQAWVELPLPMVVTVWVLPALMQREQTSQCCTSPLQNGGQIVELLGSSCSVRFQGMGFPGSV